MTTQYEDFFQKKAGEIMSEQMVIFNEIRERYFDCGLNSAQMWETAKQIRRQITLESINQHLQNISGSLSDLVKLKNGTYI